MTNQPPVLAVEHAHELADDLLRELAGHIGDRDAVAATMLRWLEVLDATRLAQVSMAALAETFSRCLTETPVDQIPDGSHVYLNPKEAA